MSTHIKPLILHAHATGPNPVKIAMALEALHVPFEVKQWDFSDNPNTGVKGTEYLKVNENGRVPAIEDPNTGVVAWESGACMNYIRRVYDNGNTIGPSGDSAQDLVDFEKWEYFLLTTLGPMSGQTNWFRLVALVHVEQITKSCLLLSFSDTLTHRRMRMRCNDTRRRPIAAMMFSKDS